MTTEQMEQAYQAVYKLHPIDDYWLIVKDCLAEDMEEEAALAWADELVLERFAEALSRI